MSIETRRGFGHKLRAVFDYDAEELRNLAYAWGPRDGSFAELLEAADELDRLNGDVCNAEIADVWPCQEPIGHKGPHKGPADVGGETVEWTEASA